MKQAKQAWRKMGGNGEYSSVFFLVKSAKFASFWTIVLSENVCIFLALLKAENFGSKVLWIEMQSSLVDSNKSEPKTAVNAYPETHRCQDPGHYMKY